VRARALAKRLGVPVVPGSPTALGSGAEAAAFIASGEGGIGFPVMLKAASGGGGRGMRVVERAAELEAAFVACQREATAAFGSGAVRWEGRLTPQLQT